MKRELRFVALKLPGTKWGIPIYPEQKIKILPRDAPDIEYSLCEVGPGELYRDEPRVRMIYRRHFLPEANTWIEWWHYMKRLGIAYMKGPLYLEDFGYTETIHI